MDCINLKKRFGKRYRIAHDEAYQAEASAFRSAEEVWLQIIPCQNGHICPWGGDNLAACTRNSRYIAERLRRMPFVTIAQDGSDGVNAVFHVDLFEEVAAIMKPRRRRVISEEQRQANITRLAKYRFSPASESGDEAQISTQGPQDGPEHQLALLGPQNLVQAASEPDAPQGKESKP